MREEVKKVESVNKRSKLMSQKNEIAEQIGISSIGIAGVTVPNLIEIADTFQALAVIFSFFFVLLPTAIWVCLRTYQAIRNHLKGKDIDAD